MEKKEFATLAMAIKTYYPAQNVLPDVHAMELWYAELKDVKYDHAAAGLRKWVKKEKWPPTIADIRQMAKDAVLEDMISLICEKPVLIGVADNKNIEME